tara:strand:+ start:9100 stop:9657 length:558 start_codon:yes stop_codon:yes gene_type:complete
MLDFNNVLMGVVVIFLIGYGLFMMRRMYKNKIRKLEKDIIFLKSNIEEHERHIVDESYLEGTSFEVNDDVNVGENDEATDVATDGATDGENDEETDEVKDCNECFTHEMQKIYDISDSPDLKKDETITVSIDKSKVEEIIIESKNEVKTELQSLTIPQLRQKLLENGETVPRNLKKRELINLLST